MAKVIFKTNKPAEATKVLKEALELEESRIKYSLNLARSRLKKFERKYEISSSKFITDWSAEELKGGDMEYVEWAGEYRLAQRLNERLATIKSIEYVAS
ncbi:MAG: hypothetical protein NT166_28710 [Candidatus Aminicenantes bacterium]|nr:hypothetical protein [Candidatus Aminicenantes bacterium]